MTSSCIGWLGCFMSMTRLLRAWIDWLSGQPIEGRAPLMLVHQLIHETDRLANNADFLDLLAQNPAGARRTRPSLLNTWTS
jgi:hypothetical protein